MRTESAMTTKELRNKPFELIVAPGLDGSAVGELYIDDGDSLKQEKITYLKFDFKDDKMTVTGKAEYTAILESITILNQSSDRSAKINGKTAKSSYDASKKCITISTGSVEMQQMTVELAVSCSMIP